MSISQPEKLKKLYFALTNFRMFAFELFNKKYPEIYNAINRNLKSIEKVIDKHKESL